MALLEKWRWDLRERGEEGVPSKSLKEQRLNSLGVSLREKPAMPVIGVVKGGVSGF